MESGSIVKLKNPINQDEASLIYIALEVHAEGDRPRAHVKPLNTGLSIPPIEVVSLSELELIN